MAAERYCQPWDNGPSTTSINTVAIKKNLLARNLPSKYYGWAKNQNLRGK
jgi:hypothetical protein